MIIWLLVKLALAAGSVAFTLFVLYHTDALTEYVSLLGLGRLLRVRAWQEYVAAFNKREGERFKQALQQFSPPPPGGDCQSCQPRRRPPLLSLPPSPERQWPDGYLAWLRTHHNGFLTRLLICPNCSCVWLAAIASVSIGQWQVTLAVAWLGLWLYKKA
jgi:hypothetical protein